MVLMMIHKIGLMLAIVCGLIYFAKRTERSKKAPSIFRFTDDSKLPFGYFCEKLHEHRLFALCPPSADGRHQSLFL